MAAHEVCKTEVFLSSLDTYRRRDVHCTTCFIEGGGCKMNITNLKHRMDSEDKPGTPTTL
jgi:hypothetical protein